MKRHTRITLTVALSLATAAAVAAFLTLSAPPDEGPPQTDRVVDAAGNAAVLDEAVARLRRGYVLPEVAAELERGLQAQRTTLLAHTSAKAFARALTASMQALAHGDRHLQVKYFEAPQPEPSDSGPSLEQAQMERQYALRRAAGIERVQRFPGNVGLLELRNFHRPATVAPRLPAVMTLLADTDALIIDLRECGGGDPDTVMLVASRFFDTKTHLNDVYWRDEDRTEARWTDPTVPGPLYGERRKLYLLMSEETGSGCEDFAYALKHSGRATLVGETSAGAAHAGSPVRLGDHFMMFLPTGRPVNPVTHTNWERVGVRPDVALPAKKALVFARIAALKHLAAHEQDADWKRRLEKSVAELE